MTATTELDPPRPEPIGADHTGLGLAILGAALLMGALGDALLRALPWGVNLPLWILAVIAVCLALARRRRVALEGGGRWLLGPALFFAAAVAWRDSEVLGALNLLGLLVALALAAFRARAGRIHIAGIADYVRGLVYAAAEAVGGPLVLVVDNIRWRSIRLGDRSGQLLALARGLVIAIPLTLVFGVLFAAADAAFAGIAGRLLRWNINELVVHAVVAATLAWIVGGFLRRFLIAIDQEAGLASGAGGGWLGIIEIGVVLGMLNGLFLLFVLVQFRYLFGGAALVEASADLTYAEYARRGFFELVTVATLVLPLLLMADWVVRKQDRARERLFRMLVGTLIVLLFVIMVSAIQRMRLYQEEYGLTELRLYTTAFMGWLALVFAWFLATVLRGHRERFAFGALMTGVAVVAVLDALNPDALIVRTNLGRLDTARPFDSAYATTLSADAVPTLVEALPALPDAERQAVERRLRSRWSPPESPDWRSWNWGRWQAWWAASTIESAARPSAAPER